MDYSKLTKDALIEILEAKNLSYSSSQSKDDLISLLITQDNKVINKESTYITSNKIGEAGAILNIVFASILSILLIWTIIFPILGFCTIVSNLRYKNGKDNKIMAGVLGILFAGLIGGIMVLLGNSNK